MAKASLGLLLLLTASLAVVLAPYSAHAQLKFEQWKSLQFTPGEIANPVISDPNADPDADSLRNLFEYALSGDPKKANPLALPILEVGGDNLVLSFTRVKAALDLTYVVEVSHDLVHWYSGDAFTEQILAIDLGETETVKVQDRTPKISLAKR